MYVCAMSATVVVYTCICIYVGKNGLLGPLGSGFPAVLPWNTVHVHVHVKPAGCESRVGGS